LTKITELHNVPSCNHDELNKPISFFIMLVGLSMFCMSIIIHTNLSGTIGWSEVNAYYQNSAEALSTEIVAFVGLGLFVTCGLVFAFVNRYPSNEVTPQ